MATPIFSGSLLSCIEMFAMNVLNDFDGNLYSMWIPLCLETLNEVGYSDM